MGWGNPEPYAELKRNARRRRDLEAENAALREQLSGVRESLAVQVEAMRDGPVDEHYEACSLDLTAWDRESALFGSSKAGGPLVVAEEQLQEAADRQPSAPAPEPVTPIRPCPAGGWKHRPHTYQRWVDPHDGVSTGWVLVWHACPGFL